MRNKRISGLLSMLFVICLLSSTFVSSYAADGAYVADSSKAEVSQSAAEGSNEASKNTKESNGGSDVQADNKTDSAVEAVQSMIDDLPDKVSDVDAVMEKIDAIDDAMDELTSEQLAQLDLSAYNRVLKSVDAESAQLLDGSDETEASSREVQEFPCDDYLESLKVVITDANGEHVVDYKAGDSTDIDLGEIQRNATLSAVLAFNPNKAAGNEGGSANPIIYGDTFTCKIPDILSNGAGGKWSGRLKDSTTNYGQKNGSIGDFTIEDGVLTIKFDKGYIEETGGNIKDASLNFSGSFDAYGWEETAFEKSLYFGNLPIKVKFPAAEVKRNLSIEKTPVNYGESEFIGYSSTYGSQGKSALSGTAKVDDDGYIAYSIKVTAAEDNTTFLDNVVISDVFTTDNVDPSSVVLLSAVKGSKDTDIMDQVVAQKDDDGNITGWNVGRLNRGEEATITFKIKIDKDKITEDVDAVRDADRSSSAEEARLLKNTASATADKLTKPVTDDAATKVQNWVYVSKSRDGTYDPKTATQKFKIAITVPKDNKYTEHNVYIKDSMSSYVDQYIKDTGILSVEIKHADGSVTKSTEEDPLYNGFVKDYNYQWHAYLDELKPGDVATVTAYLKFDTDKWYTEAGYSATNGINGSSNYAYVGGDDLKQSYDSVSCYITKAWLSKSGSYSQADGTITWTMTGNSYDSDLPDANVEGMTVTDTIGSYQKMVDSEVLVTFYEPNSTTVRPYTGANASDDGKLVVPTTDTGFSFVVPEGYGDCKYVIKYKTKVTNNYGPSQSYYNTGKLGIWSYQTSTYRPRIASIEKQYVERGADWAKWNIKILGPVKDGDSLTDSITSSKDNMWMNVEDMDGLSLTFNGETVDRDLYTLEPTWITSGSNMGFYSGFEITFKGSITSTDDNGKEITPTSQNPVVITYKTHLKHSIYASQTQYNNSSSMTVDGAVVDTSFDYFYRSTNPEISKTYKKTVGSDITWTLSVNKNGYGCYKIDENKNPIYYENNGKGQQSGYYAIVTETIPKGLKYVTAKYAGTKGYYADVPTIEELGKTVNEDGSTTVKLLIGNLKHYEVNPNNSYTGYNSSGYYRVDIDVVTQIVDEECLLDTTGKDFEWDNKASLTSMDGQPYEASATMNIAHTALTKEMKYDESTAPNAQFTIDMNEEEFDLNPDGDAIKVFDKSSSSLVVDTSSIKVVDTRDNSPVDFVLDASQMAADGTFSLEVPDNMPLRITYEAGVSGVKDEVVSVSNVAYFEGQKIEEVTSVINKEVKVLNAAAQAQSDVMIWLRKMDATGKILPGCTFKLEKYTADDGWTTVNDSIVSEDDTKYATKVGGLEKNILYRVVETEAAENYILDATPHYFCLKVSEDSEVALPEDLDSEVFYCPVAALINAYNRPNVKVKFSKQDEEGAFLPGATFKVVNKDGDTIKDKNGKALTFTVSDEGALPEFYVEPGTYKLVETKAPDGYLSAADITFVVNSDETVSVGGKRVTDNTVICKDEPTSITIKKLDGSVTPEAALEGATLQVLDGTTVKAEWTTDGEDHEITGVLNTGKTYTLHETEAPDGYLLADDIDFTINTDGEVVSTGEISDGSLVTNVDEDGALVMIDEKPELDIVKVNKTKHTVVEAGAPLAGVSLTMTQGDTEIRTWTTAVDADDASKAVPEHFDNLEAGKAYTIHENSAPDGYQTISDFTITPNADGTFTVTGDNAAYSDGVLTIKNKYVPTPVDATIKVHKEITGSPISDKDFTFELKEAGSNKTEQITITGAGDADFAKMTFTEAGTHTYTVREIAGEDNGYTYSTATHTVVITVSDDGKGTLSKTVAVDGEEGSTVTFTNAYKALETALRIPVNKEFTEDSAERPSDEEFTFTIEGKTGDEPMPESDSVVSTEAAAGVFGDITYTEVGTYEYTVSEKNDGKTGYTYADPVNIKVVVKDLDGQLGATMFIVKDSEDDEANGASEAATDLTFVNEYKPLETTLQIPVTKLFTKDSSRRPSVEEFAFTIKGKTGDEPVPETATTTASEKVQGLFGEITYTSAGTYEYTVSEKNDGKKGYNYAEPVDVKVIVSDVEGQLVTAIYVGDVETDAIEFTNSYTAPDEGKPEDDKSGKNNSKPGTGDDNGLESRFLVFLSSGLAAAYLGMKRRRQSF